MFEKWESNTYANTSAAELHKAAFQWWHSTGFHVQETGPGSFRAASESRWGLRREVDVSVRDHGGNAVVELRMRAHVSTEGVVGGGLALILVWPVAVAGGAYSYAKYESDARDLMSAFWNTMNATAQVSPDGHREKVLQTTAVPTEEVREAEVQVPHGPVGEAGPALSREQKLAMLEDRLARWEISEDTYKGIRARME